MIFENLWSRVSNPLFDCLRIIGQGFIYPTLIHKFSFFFSERELQNMNISMLVCSWISAVSGYKKGSRVSKLKVLSFLELSLEFNWRINLFPKLNWNLNCDNVFFCVQVFVKRLREITAWKRHKGKKGYKKWWHC